jgi:hypothetical protein
MGISRVLLVALAAAWSIACAEDKAAPALAKCIDLDARGDLDGALGACADAINADSDSKAGRTAKEKFDVLKEKSAKKAKDDAERAAQVTAPSPPIPETPLPNLPALAHGVELNISTEVVNAGPKVRVRGETNLPDDTQLIISVQETGDFGTYFPTDSVVVRRGRFETSSLGPDDGWAEGELEANAELRASDQPQAVQAVIGLLTSTTLRRNLNSPRAAKPWAGCLSVS